jgi:hypothetical protein
VEVLRPVTTSSNVKPLLAKLTLALLSLAFAGSLLEVLVRASGRDAPPLWRPDPELGWAGIPGARQRYTAEGNGLVELNVWGLRGPDWTLDKPLGTTRIMVFGDSMTEAVQVDIEQSFTHLLERRLRGAGRRVEVLNFGVNGYSPLQELLLWRRLGARFQPDVVVQALFLDNDVAAGSVATAGNRGQADAPVVTFDGHALGFDARRAEASYNSYNRQPMAFLRENSALYRTLNFYRRRFTQVTQATAATVGRVPLKYELYMEPPPPAWEPAWANTERLVLEFEREVRKQGASFVVLSVPAPVAVHEASWAAEHKTFPRMAEHRWNLQGPDDRLRAFAAAHGIRLIETRQAFVEAADSLLFFRGIGHMTPRGHEVMAEALERGLIDRDIF